MNRFNKKKKWIILLMLSCLLTGCSDNNSGKVQESTYSVLEENEDYQLALSEKEAFKNMLQDFIYWEYATMIEKEGESFFSILEKENCLETEMKLHFFYRKYDVEEMDEAESDIYNIIVTFPDKKELSYFSMDYNARGLSSKYDYGYGYGRWFSDSLEDDISSQELEKSKWFQKHYTSFGETSLRLKKSEAESYKVKDKFPAGEKERILSAVQASIKEEYKEEEDLVVYVRDFLPGDQSLSGEVVNLNIINSDDMPLYWICSEINYTGNKMEEFQDIHWYTHYSTGYSGASNPDYNPTVNQVKEWAKEEKEAVNVEKCILAYHIKNGEMIDLKDMQLTQWQYHQTN
ncbi:MAG: hypothetical protein K2N51_03095 [Lachnospiraceae bacterium]|nr:hypothetical protein [Lachnospiraceae bacterium]